MATNTYVALDKVTLGVDTSTVTFNSIPQGYTDLILVISTRATSTGGSQQLFVNFNGETTGTNYSQTFLYGNGTLVGSSRGNSQSYIYAADVSDSQSSYTGFSNVTLQIQDYSNTTTSKNVLSRLSAANVFTEAVVGSWASTAAITSISLDIPGSPQFVSGSTFSLYGIKSVGVTPAPKATGGAIYDDSTYYYHVFGSTGTFTPLASLTADVLVVAGGGGGGYVLSGYTNRAAGGAGAGGLLGFASQSLTATGYTVTVGAGGNGGSGGTNTNGTNSQFGALTAAVGGGYGGVPGVKNANTGVSGGGGADNNGPANGTSGQGFAGAGGFDPGSGSSYSGGGGGGATAAGSAGAANNGGAGGLGSSAYTSWATATGTGVNGVYAAGGRGGSSATGSSTFAATANTGNGGIGSAITANTNGANGGSGIVIVRYAKI